MSKTAKLPKQVSPLLPNPEPDETNPKDRIGITKPQLHLVPPALTIHVAKAMENGEQKFGAYNWRAKKVRSTVYISAALRHLLAYLDGEDVAQDSKVHHLGHAAACMGIVLDAEATGNLIDDRPEKGAAARLIEQFTQTGLPASVPAPYDRVRIYAPAVLGWFLAENEGYTDKLEKAFIFTRSAAENLLRRQRMREGTYEIVPV
jgi:Domain of unknown function (DUF5664)